MIFFITIYVLFVGIIYVTIIPEYIGNASMDKIKNASQPTYLNVWDYFTTFFSLFAQSVAFLGYWNLMFFIPFIIQLAVIVACMVNPL